MDWRMRFVLCALALAGAGNAWAFWPFGGAEKGPFVIAEEGVAKAAIVVRTEGREKGYRYAANELADYLGRMTGARFAVVNEPLAGLATIRVGTAYAPSKTDELHIEVKSSELLEITGDDALGTLYGVYDLLEQFGCRFYCMDFEKVPTTNRLELAADYVRTDAPFMTGRECWCGAICADDPRVSAFAMKQRSTRPMKSWLDFKPEYRNLGIDQTLTSSYIPRRTFFDAKNHPETYRPEWYALRTDGTRCEHALCVSQDAMYEELYREIEFSITGRLVTAVSLGVDDGWELCHCPGCEKITLSDPAHSNGGQNIRLLNRVARHFAARCPKVRFNMLVYGHQNPQSARDFALEPNAGVGFALLWRNHCRPVYACERVATDVVNWRAFSSLGMANWDYGCNFFCYAMPFPNHDTFGYNFRYYREIGVTGMGSQMQLSANGDLAELHWYLYGRLCWNPDADDRALTEEFVRDVYGPGARDVMDYIDLCVHARDRQKWFWGGCYISATDAWLTGADCVRIWGICERLKAFAKNAPRDRRAHLNRARISMLYLCGTRVRDMLAANPKLKLPPQEELAAEYRRLFYDGLNDLPWTGDLGERFGQGDCRFQIAHAPREPYVERKGREASFRVGAERMDGGERRTLLKDADGTPFVRLDTKPRGSESTNALFMDPSKAECGTVVGEAHAGTWYCFATIRTETTVDWECASCFFGLYLNTTIPRERGPYRNQEEVCTLFRAGAKGDTAWRTSCLGKYRLVGDSRLWVMPGTVNPVGSVDVREFAFVASEWFDDERNAAAYAGCGQMRLSKGGRHETDRYDRFRYAHLDAAALSNDAPAIVCTLNAKQTQTKAHVFARVRVGATVPRERVTGRLVLRAAVLRGAKGPGAVLATADVGGSPGDDGWQIVSLGVHDLAKDMTVELVPGGATPLRFLDMRDVHLIPAAMLH